MAAEGGALTARTGRRTQNILFAPPSFGPDYQLVFGQDFMDMTSITQLNVVAGYSLGKGTWISHTPTYQDWFTFIDPVDNFKPFGIGNGFLTIRADQRGYGDPYDWFGGYSSGLLSSMDAFGKGFAQQYGYFEVCMQTPGGANTWPAFWLLDQPSLVNRRGESYGSEIDVTESYGNWGTGPGQFPPGQPDWTTMSWHRWGFNGNPTTQGERYVQEPGMSTGFHTYGVDIEPTTTTWYFDRSPIWQIPTPDVAKRPMYLLLDLALGNGNYNNPAGNGYNWSLTPTPSDLRVRYIAVWASPSSPNYVSYQPPVSGSKPQAGMWK